MKLKTLLTEKDAVSPVIGVILMVAITVILAAVIGAFVLDLGSDQESAPQASWEYSFNSGEVTVDHSGGDEIDTSQLTVDAAGTEYGESSFTTTGTISSGDELLSQPYGGGDKIKVIWQKSNGEGAQVIGDQEVP